MSLDWEKYKRVQMLLKSKHPEIKVLYSDIQQIVLGLAEDIFVNVISFDKKQNVYINILNLLWIRVIGQNYSIVFTYFV